MPLAPSMRHLVPSLEVHRKSRHAPGPFYVVPFCPLHVLN